MTDVVIRNLALYSLMPLFQLLSCDVKDRMKHLFAAVHCTRPSAYTPPTPTPIFRYTYKLGHRLFNGTIIWSQEYQFKAPPYPGQNSVQRVVVFGDMGKVLFHSWKL